MKTEEILYSENDVNLGLYGGLSSYNILTHSRFKV